MFNVLLVGVFAIPPIEYLVQLPISDPGPASGGGWELLAAAALLAIIVAFEIYRSRKS